MAVLLAVTYIRAIIASFLATFSAFTEKFESVGSETLESFTDFGHDVNATNDENVSD